MNKKNLSVVMAGAMLATSVAPVLAETTTVDTYEVTKGNAGLLIDKLDALFETKFDKMDSNEDLADKSVYGYLIREAGETTWQKIQAGGTLTAVSGDEAKDGIDDTSLIKALVNNASNATKEYEIKIIDRGHREENGKVLSTEAVTIDWDKLEANKKYTDSELDAYNAASSGNHATDTAYNDMVKSEAISDVSKAGSGVSTVLTLTYGAGNKQELKVDSPKLDFSAPINNKGELLTVDYAKRYPTEVFGFKTLAETTAEKTDIKEKELYRVNLVNGDAKVEYNTDDLYDGFMLTTKGHELLNEVVEAGSTNVKYGADASFTDADIETVIDKDGNNYRTKVTITDENGNVKIVTIKGSNKDRLKTLCTWLDAEKASVDILAGDNRYATAVEIAKTYINTANQYKPGASGSASTVNEIVLVNGEALVDGLAAAPYAHKQDAPILLTADNKLPKETKDYLKEIMTGKQVTVGTPSIKVTIIGGTSVVSKDVADELKDMGFNVNRISGDNREQTSLEVAEAMGTMTNAFVVGAEGEADAMSIASYAAATETPIIVSKSKNGLSTMALNDLSKMAGKAVIIGGENVVPANDEETLKEALGKEDVSRIAGKNRQETNAMVIKKYHKTYPSVLVAKDGTANKTELVDALAVSLFASSTANTGTFNNTTIAAPIVLATNSVSKDQLNQLVLGNGASLTSTVYQVGYGVDRSVMETVVKTLGLNK